MKNNLFVAMLHSWWYAIRIVCCSKSVQFRVRRWKIKKEKSGNGIYSFIINEKRHPNNNDFKTFFFLHNCSLFKIDLKWKRRENFILTWSPKKELAVKWIPLFSLHANYMKNVIIKAINLYMRTERKKHK